jgi:DNA-directed RNA polymerase specialized sigma subunit
MTPKEYLQQYRDAVRRAAAALDHLHELQSMATRITPLYGGEGGGGQHQSGDEKMQNAVDKIIEAKNRVSDELEMLEATEREVVGMINSVDEPFRTLLYERYINAKTFEQIAVSMSYSWRQTIRLHGRALLAVKNVIECHI